MCEFNASFDDSAPSYGIDKKSKYMKNESNEKRVTKSTFAIIEQIPIILRTCFHIEKESFHWII